MRFITDTMTYEEIANVIIENVMPSLNYQMGDYNNKLRRVIIKNKKVLEEDKHYFTPFCYKKGNLNVHLVGCSHGKTDYNYCGLTFVVYVTFMYQNGLHAAMIAGAKYDLIQILTPHLLDRYQERLSKTESNRESLILEYYKNNATVVSDLNKIPEGIQSKYNKENSTFVSVQEGIVIEERITKNVFVGRTFVSKELMKQNQIKDADTQSLQVQIYESVKYKTDI